MSGKNDMIFFGTQEPALSPSPINPDWIIEGAPIARTQILSQSTDRWGTALIWHCTKGRFNWHYGVDETVYILEGSVVVTDDDGVEHRLGPGDHALFRAGSHAVWTIDDYVRKVAFCRTPLPKIVVVAKDLAKQLLVAIGLRAPTPQTQPTFGS